MTTAVIYVDEAGNPDSHREPLVSGETPLFTLTGVAFALAEWRLRDRAFLRLKRQFFPDMMGRPAGSSTSRAGWRGSASTSRRAPRSIGAILICDSRLGALDYGHAAALWPLLEAIQFESAGQVGGFQVFGFRVVDQRGDRNSAGSQ